MKLATSLLSLLSKMIVIAFSSLLIGILLVADLMLGLVDAACFVAHNAQCPNENVSFWLYSDSTRDAPVLLNPLDLQDSHFEPRLPIRILIHGYTGYRDFAPNDYVRPAFLDNEAVYVISVDYGPLVREPCYLQAVQNLPVASRCLAQLIDNLLEKGLVQAEELHVIGFSLGGQVAGQTANYVKRKLKRITGLDPAKPLFITASQERVLDEGDAEFVDVIHTDVLGRGMLRTMGHADFYPNFGPRQPGCREENPTSPGSCNHDRAPRFFAESIGSQVGFWARKCSSWIQYQLGLCPSDEPPALMGYHVSKKTRGTYYLRSASKPPFALGKGESSDRNANLPRHKEFVNKHELESLGFFPDLKENAVERAALEKELNLEEQASRTGYRY